MANVSNVPIPQEPYLKAIVEHYTSIWSNGPKPYVLKGGPIQQLSPGFCVLEFAPSLQRKDMWTYATCGMSYQSDATKLELHLFSPHRTDELVELLTAVSHYHLTGDYLDWKHTVNFGRPWLPESQCSYGLISLPYLDGPKLEWMDADSIKTRFLWLVPITSAERDYKKENGLEALEEQFEKKGLHYFNPARPSVV